MYLSELLPKLSANANLNISIVESINGNDVNIITFNAAGWASLDDDLKEKEVSRITVEGSKSITIKVFAGE